LSFFQYDCLLQSVITVGYDTNLNGHGINARAIQLETHVWGFARILPIIIKFEHNYIAYYVHIDHLILRRQKIVK
jgi:hypothetical protein